MSIKGLTMDSRRVKPGDLFIAVQGLTVDGRAFIEEALQKGATAVLVEEGEEALKHAHPPYQQPLQNGSFTHPLTRPIIPIPNLRNLIGPIAARFYAEPSKHIPVIGVTGTNGKTSTTHFIAQILSHYQTPCPIMGTLGFGFLDHLKSSRNPREMHCTTQDAIATQETLADLRQQGAKAVAMEVTSHSLSQGRVEGIVFNTAIWTNLTRDHLEYHGRLEDYWAAKKSLFTHFQPKVNIINLDDEYGCQLIEELYHSDPNKQIIGFTVEPGQSQNHPKAQRGSKIASEKNLNAKIAVISAEQVQLDNQGIHAWINSPWGEGPLQCPLLGRFNLSNLLAAIAAVCVQGIPLSQVLKFIPHLLPVPGRMMRFGGNAGLPLVIVDYAHTPDALTQVLTAIRSHCRGQLWCVFGCGGDRDRGKRPIMMQAAKTLSDKVIITQDNPRNEDPKQIIADITQHLEKNHDIPIELDRSLAIAKAIAVAGAEDVVVIAGKGHENVQIIGAEKLPFSDQTEVLKALERRSQ